jgi:hypothetical protein
MNDKDCPTLSEYYSNLDSLKKQVSEEIGVELSPGSRPESSGCVPIHRCGDVGGNMVKRMIEDYERKLIDKK